VISEIYWVFYNICIHIDCTDENADVIPLARYLQQQMQKGLVPSAKASRPQFERVEVSSTRVPVGEEFRTWIVLPASLLISNLEIEIDYDSDRLQFRESSKIGWVLKGKAPGRAKIKFHATDKRTLLRNSFSTYVEVIQ